MAIVVAGAMPAILVFVAVCIEICTLAANQAETQRAADVSALAGAYALAKGGSQQAAAIAAAEIAEVNGMSGAGGRSWNASTSTLSDNQITVIMGQSGQSATVAIARVIPLTVTAAIGLRSSATLSASAMAGVSPTNPCVYALSAPGIQVNNAGSITASGCGIFSDAPGSQSIYLNSGTISGTSIGAVGTVATSGGGNTLSPSPGTSNAAAQTPTAPSPTPTAGACTYPTGTSFSAGAVFCGNTTLQGNGTALTFAPGIYYVSNGSLTFSNATIAQAQNVTFVFTGSSPGGFNWTNNSSGTMTAPSSGATSGILVWQICPSSGTPGLNTFAGGSTLRASGEFYLPCGALALSNNAHLTTVAGSSMSVVAASISVAGSAGLAPASGSSGGGTGGVALMQ